VLLTRSPLSPVPKDWFSLDLHVLSAPPAFVLSQDQTLREEVIVTSIPEGIGWTASSTMSLKLKVRLSAEAVRLTGLSLRPRRRTQVSAFVHAVEFSKTVARLTA
jgi:hypothetical protein